MFHLLKDYINSRTTIAEEDMTNLPDIHYRVLPQAIP